jgi:hypothetical protein
VIAKHRWDVMSLRLRGSVFTEQLSRNGFHSPIVPFLVRVLLKTAVSVGQLFFHGANAPNILTLKKHSGNDIY